MWYLQVLRKQILIIVVFYICRTEQFSSKANDNRTQCLHTILAQVFGDKIVQYMTFKKWKPPTSLPYMTANYENLIYFHNVAIEGNLVEMEKVINKVGYDGNIFLVTSNNVTVNHSDILVDTWLKYRTKLAFLIFSNETTDLITNIYHEAHLFCPNMEYKVIKNVCSDTPNVLTMKIPIENFCTLKISYVNVHPFVNDVRKSFKGGIMVSWVRTFGEIRRFTVNFVRDNQVYQSEFLNNGSFHKLVGDLVARKQDVAIGQLFMNSSDQYPVDFGPVIYMDRIGFIHRKLNRISDYKKMIVVFDKRVWSYIAIIFSIVVPIYFVLNYFVDNNMLTPTVVMTDIFRLGLGSSIPITPNSFSLRILFVAFCLFSITITSTYLGKLSEIFTNPPTDLQEDIWEHGVRVHISFIVDRLSLISYYVRLRNDQRQQKGAGNSIVNKSDQELLRMVSVR